MKADFYVLSDDADIDVDTIFEYSLDEFGIDKAIAYHEGLIKLFKQLTQFPEEGKARNEIKNGLRSMVYFSHIIFYRILSDHIRIVRVLHQSQNIGDNFR
jgi:toxin ParE1/3/4